VRMRLFSGIEVTETLVGIGEVRDRKTRNISTTGRLHNSDSLDGMFSPFINNAYARSKSIGERKRERTRRGCAGQQRSSYAGYVGDVHSGW
jgi:hypothetical protein